MPVPEPVTLALQVFGFLAGAFGSTGPTVADAGRRLALADVPVPIITAVLAYAVRTCGEQAGLALHQYLNENNVPPRAYRYRPRVKGRGRGEWQLLRWETLTVPQLKELTPLSKWELRVFDPPAFLQARSELRAQGVEI